MSGHKKLQNLLMDSAAAEISQMDTSGKFAVYFFYVLKKIRCKNRFTDEEIDEIMDNLLEDLEVVPLFRYTFVSKVPKNLSWYEQVFPLYDD